MPTPTAWTRTWPTANAWRYRDYVDRRLQPRQALRPVRPRADRRRPAARGRRRRPRFERLIATGLPGARPEDAGRGRPGEDGDGHHRRAGRHDRPGVHGPDARLRPLPRPQVRSDPHGRLLLAGRASSKARRRWRTIAWWRCGRSGRWPRADELAAAAAHTSSKSPQVRSKSKAIDDAAERASCCAKRRGAAGRLSAGRHRASTPGTHARSIGDARCEPDRTRRRAVVIEAEAFARGNVVRDFDDLWAGDRRRSTMPGRCRTSPNTTSSCRAAGTYQLALRYAAAETRPVRDFARRPNDRSRGRGRRRTGSWQPDTQTWSIEAVVRAAGGQARVAARARRAVAAPRQAGPAADAVRRRMPRWPGRPWSSLPRSRNLNPLIGSTNGSIT